MVFCYSSPNKQRPAQKIIGVGSIKVLTLYGHARLLKWLWELKHAKWSFNQWERLQMLHDL